MQDHEAEGSKKVGSATQNEEVALSPKKKTKHPFSVIKKSIKVKNAEPKSDEPYSNILVLKLGSTPKNGRASTIKKVVNAKKKVIERPRAKRRKRRPRVKRRKKRALANFNGNNRHQRSSRKTNKLGVRNFESMESVEN
jgi:hypothetical protein